MATAKKTKRNIPRGKNKKKKEAAKQRAIEAKQAAGEEVVELTPAQLKEKEKADKEAAKAIEAKKKKKEREANPTFWDKTVAYFKSTITELKKTQWLTTAQLNKATGAVVGVVAISTAATWVVDSGLGALTAFILGI